MSDQILTDKPKSEWKPMAFLAIGVVVGLLAGAQFNTEQTAKGMANAMCGVCQDNINTMVNNFNVLAHKCPELSGQAQAYKDLPVFINNSTVRVYAP